MLVTLLTDFGTADHFVAAMKGVVLSVDPAARLVDISHEMPPQDVRTAAFTLLAVYRTFPAATIHVAVVDPGVGSARRPVVARAGGQLFVGPDNGIFSYVFDREPDAEVIELTEARFFRSPVSATFHGRDIFAPVAGALSTGIAPATMGKRITDPVRLESLGPRPGGAGALQGFLLHIDRFGNCITNLTRADLPPDHMDSAIRLEINGREIRTLRRYYSESDPADDTPFAIWGSAGFLEIAVNRGSAARLLGARRGDPVRFRVED